MTDKSELNERQKSFLKKCEFSKMNQDDLDNIEISDDEALNNKDNEIQMLKLTIEEQKIIIAQLRAELAERTENTEVTEKT